MKRRLVFAGIFAGLAALMLLIATDQRITYSPFAGHVAQYLYDRFGTLRGWESPIGFVTIDEILRKCYALIAFTVLGIGVAPLFSPRRRILGAALAITQFSNVIEIVQDLTGSKQSLGRSGFDILSGTAGGVAGALIYGLVVRRLRGRSG